ncbi:MAG TPA: hypothetical protein VJ722_06340, partial [Rhodanobacteraceae bacterium]|nr:hypothetical protein [Rhodanobacteraceae bacterium]
EAYRASIRISSRLAAEAPANVARQLTLADTLSAVSVLYWDQRKLDEGLRVVESVRQVLNRALLHAKGNPDLLKVLATNEHNAGIALEAAGRMGEADAVFRKELQLQQSLLHRIVVKAGDPITDDLGSAHQDLGKLALLRGDLATTVSQMAAYDDFETRLSESHPKQNVQRFRMMLSHADHGYALSLAGEAEAGSRYLRQAVELAEALRAADPRNADHAAIGAYFSTRFAQTQRADGDAAAAMKINEKALVTLAGVLRANPGNRAWQRWHAMAQIEKGTQARAAGRSETARVQARSALHTLEPMLAANPEDRDVLLTVVTAKLLLASVESDAAAARTLREQALRSMQSVQIAHGDPRLLALQVEAELALGKNAEAQALVKRLWSSGYRHFALVDVLRKAHIDYPRNPDFHAALAAAEPPDPAGATPQAAAGSDDRR